MTCSLLLGASLHGGEIAVREALFAGVWSPFGTRWRADSPVCVWERGGESVFVVAATGRSDGRGFRLSNAAGDFVRYRLFWHRRDGNGPREELVPGRVSRHGIRASAQPDCGGGANARLSVRIHRTDIERAPSGVYGDTLLLTLSSL